MSPTEFPNCPPDFQNIPLRIHQKHAISSEKFFFFWEGPIVPIALAPSKRWRRGVVVIVVRRMNEVTLRRARLVLGWVTVFGRVYHHGT